MAEQSTFDRVLASMGKPPESAIAKVYDAYASGAMPASDAAQFESDVRAGRVMLPRGAALKAAAPSAPAAAPEAPAGVIAAYNDGRMTPPEKAQFEDDLRAGRWALPANLGISNGAISARIPGAPQVSAAPAPEPGIVDKAIGTGEAALTTATGATGGALGIIGGTLKGLAEAILSGNFGTQDAANLVEKAAAEGGQALTYAPRTQSGQDQAAAVGNALQQVLPVAAVLPGMAPAATGAAPARVMARAGAEGVARDAANLVARPAEAVGAVAPGAAGDAAAGAVAAGTQAAGDAAQRVAMLAKGATTLPRRALERLTGSSETAPTPGTMGSAGAAGTDVAAQRRALAADLPVPIELTKGQATRDPAQLKFETETAKIPDAGQPLRQRLQETNQAILDNFDHWADQTGAQAPTLRATGQAVDAALVDKARRAKAEVNARYGAANRSEEARTVADQSLPVAIGEGDNALTSTPIDYINGQPTGLPSTAVPDAARQYAVKLGVADMQDGRLVPRQDATIRQLEDWRKAIGQATGYEPADIRHSTILKALIDGQTEPIAGPLYRQARAARARYAQEFEDRAVIAKLLNNKRGTADRQVAFEDVYKHSILDGSLDDVRTVRKVLQTSGEQGQQAWRELQGATLRDIRDKATASVALDGTGNRVVSPAALDKAINALDADGKLDFIFGKKGAQQLRDIRELAQIAKTVPPEAAVNMSNTAMTLLAFGDVAASGLSGLPFPVLTAGRMGLKYIKDRALRQRIDEALNNAERRAPGRRGSSTPQQAPARSTMH